MTKQYLNLSQAYSKLEVSGSGTDFIRKTELIGTNQVDPDKLAAYANQDFVVDDDIVKRSAGDITDGLIFYVPFTDGTAKDIINNVLPSGGYVKDNFGHKFSKGGKYNVRWSIPVEGTFSIMYKYVSKGSTRAFAFGYYGPCYSYSSEHYVLTGYDMGIWSNVANGGSLCGGNRQWPRGGSSTTSGMWTDDYHVATFVYDFRTAAESGTIKGVYYGDKRSFLIYKDGVNVTGAENNTMWKPDGTSLNYVTIGGGIAEADRTNEYTTLYCKDARIYNRRLSEPEIQQLVNFCNAKK